MVSDSELVERLREILLVSDLEKTTANVIRRRLEEDFSIDLQDRRVFIREQIDLFLKENEEEPEEEGIENDSIGEEEQQGEVKQEEESGTENEEEEEEKSDEDRRSKRNRTKSNPAKMESEVKKKGGGFCKPCALSPQLEKLLGVSELPRTQVVKKIWEYIRENDLQNPKNKRKILCDESMREVFKVNSIGMFQMNKVLSKHIWPLDEGTQMIENDSSEMEEEEEEEQRDVKQEEESGTENEEEESDEDRRKRKKSKPAKMDSEVKKKGGGFCKPCALSPQLETLLGVSELPRTQVVKKIWEYIREKDLQNPKDKRKILCDESMREVFKVNSIDMFQMNKVLSKHIWPLDEVVTSVESSQKKRQPKQEEEYDSDEPKRKEKPKPKKGGKRTTTC